ncbi:MAG: Tab2 family RNA-binding protein [Cyanobacteria bacterium P01_E01_bin.42]
MTIWQADLHSSSTHAKGEPSWELILCDRQGRLIYEATCSREEILKDWLIAQLPKIPEPYPERLQIFRPQCAELLQNIAAAWDIPIETTRHTAALKQLLKQRGNAIAVDKPPPQPLPDRLWGEQWRFASLSAADVVREFCDRPIPIRDIPDAFEPRQRGLSSSAIVPGIIVEGGRQAMPLARWVQEARPYALDYIPAEVGRSGGIVLEAGLSDRWVFQTFNDPEIARAAEEYQQRLDRSQGLHFLLIQPDGAIRNFTGYWLLLKEE